MSMHPVTANARERILVVEDETDVRELLSLQLRRAGLEVDSFASAEEALLALAGKTYDVILLDWMLPGMNGIDFARSVRSKLDRHDIAILMLTAKSEPQDIVQGLEAGADDYITKPFEPTVLLARVRALLRRSRRGDAVALDRDNGFQVLRAGALALYPETYECKCAGQPITLTPSEFKLLVALVQNRGRVLTRDALIGQVQGEGVSVVGRTVDTHVFGLRKKLGECSEIVETVRGVGYRVKSEA